MILSIVESDPPEELDGLAAKELSVVDVVSGGPEEI
jgi:hypothetical protein